jgi:hypothetical protein
MGSIEFFRDDYIVKGPKNSVSSTGADLLPPRRVVGGIKRDFVVILCALIFPQTKIFIER